jgi:hypothetical protein
MSETAHPARETPDKPKPHKLMIIVADGEGDEAKVHLASDATLAELLGEGLDALYDDGSPRNAADYDLVIGGVAQTDLGQTLAAAGLHNKSEVVIVPKDVSRG